MPACCARSASTAPRPISTPTCRRTIISTSRTITSWSTFPIRIWCCRGCRKCPKATRSPASTWSCGCARSASRRRRKAGLPSLHLLVRVDAPQALLLDPAVESVAGDAAPAIGAFLDLRDDAGLQAGRHRAGGVGMVIERGQFVLALHGDDGGAPSGQQG